MKCLYYIIFFNLWKTNNVLYKYHIATRNYIFRLKMG